MKTGQIVKIIDKDILKQYMISEESIAVVDEMMHTKEGEYLSIVLLNSMSPFASRFQLFPKEAFELAGDSKKVAEIMVILDDVEIRNSYDVVSAARINKVINDD